MGSDGFTSRFWGMTDFSDQFRKIIPGVRLHDGPDLKLFILVGWERSFRLLLGTSGLNCLSSFASDFQWC